MDNAPKPERDKAQSTDRADNDDATNSNTNINIDDNPLLQTSSDERLGSVSPFSTFSLAGGTLGSLQEGGGGGEEEDNASESGSSSIGVGSSSSTQTGKRSLRRRAQEFDRLLTSQRAVLTDYDDGTPRNETEDDGLHAELQDLARSEILLRKELEIFASSFQRQPSSRGSGDNDNQEDDDDDMDDSSTLPDYEDPALIRNVGSSPRSKLLGVSTTTTTPGMAPWTPDATLAAVGTTRVSMDSCDTNDLDLPTFDEMRQRRKRMLDPSSPTAQPSMPPRNSDSLNVNHVHEDEEEEEESPPGPRLQYPANLSMAQSPLQNSSQRLPLDACTPASSPARVSLDNEVPSVLESSYLPASSYSPLSNTSSPLSTPPRLKIEPILEGLSSAESSDDSIFMDLAKLSSGTTPRVSNIKGGQPGKPLYGEPSPSSQLSSSMDQDSPRFSSSKYKHNPSTAGTATSGTFWSQPLSSSARLHPSYGKSSAVAYPSHESLEYPSVTTDGGPDENDAFVIRTPASNPNVKQRDNYHQSNQNDDHLAVLDNYVGTSWKTKGGNQHAPTLYPSNTTPFLSNSSEDDDDQEVCTPPGEQMGEYLGRRPRRSRRRGLGTGWLAAHRRGSQAPLLRVSTSLDSTDEPLGVSSRRRNHCGLALCLGLLLCGICAVVVPTTVVVTRDRRNNDNRSAVLGGAQGTVVNNPTVSGAPSRSPSLSPSVLPTVSSKPSASDAPSAAPTLTSLPTTTQPSDLPSVSPSVTPTEGPTNFPTYVPSSVTSATPSTSPTATQQPSEAFRVPTFLPSLLPTARPTILPTAFPTSIPTARPTILPTAFPTSIPTVGPSQTPSTVSSIPTTISLEDLALGPFLERVSFDNGQALNDINSPQHAAYQWLMQDPGLPMYEDEQVIQRYAMATIYYSLGGDGWLRNDNWLSTQSECSWFSRVARGVCRPGARRLQRNPSDRMFTMRRLVLYYNDLSGTLPPEIGLLTDLEEIHLMGGPKRFISGSLPSELGYLTSVKEVHLQGNNLTGTIPSSFQAWNELEYLNMSNNFLDGPLLDDVVGGWNRLNELNLSFNALTGRLPDAWPTSLEFLDLDQNQLTGPVPPSIGIMQNLRLLSLSDNLFTSLPSDIVSLQRLEELSIVNNLLQGPIISELGFLSSLKSMRLSNNRLTGGIPVELGSLDQLAADLDLSSNFLRGTIPPELGNVNRKLVRLSLAGNELFGTIPESLASLERLTEVRLENNDLTGSVPNALCAVWDRSLATAFLDCAEVICVCCNFCCTETEGCLCRYADDPDLAWRCH